MAAVVSSVLNDIENVSRTDLEKVILVSVARQGAAYSLAYYNIVEQGFPFLKKSPVWLSDRSSDITLDILDQIGSAAALEAEQEALELRTRLLQR